MATIIRMPEVAANATHATLVAWSMKEGDTIVRGQSIADIETEKAIIELNVETDGTILRLLVKNGTEVPVGAPIAVLINAGETVLDADHLLQSAQRSDTTLSVQNSRDHFETFVAENKQGRRIFSSPVARLLAKQHNLDIGTISGSGPNGRVVKYDVLRTIQQGGIANTKTAKLFDSVANTNRSATADTYIDYPHSNMRRTIARRLHESKSTIPHFYLTIECRMDKLLGMRSEINAQTQSKISINDFIVLAAARTLRDIPAVNVSWTETALRQFQFADISIAVSTDSGLITPILRNVNSKSLTEISHEVRALADRARQGQLRSEEFQGGSFSITNLGMYGIEEFAAIINPPQVAILAIGAVKSQPIVNPDRAIEVGQVMRCTLSADHRAVDGALAAKWLSAFRHYVESPCLILV